MRIWGFHFQLDAPPPTSYSHIGRGLYAPGCSKRIKSGGKKICYPSHKKTFVCLPGSSKPLTRLGSTQRQQSLSSLSLSPSLFSPQPFPPILFELICQYNADIQWFVCTSSPEGTSAQNLLMQADRSGTHTHKHTPKHKINAKINAFTPKADFPHLSQMRVC